MEALGEVLGIMTDRFRPQSATLRRLSVHARKESFGCIVVFTPSEVDLKRRRIEGYARIRRRWKRVLIRFPAIVHDIGYYADKYTISQVKRIKYRSPLRFTGYGIGNKAEVDAALRQHPHILEHLIPSVPLANLERALPFLHECERVMVKPLNGCKGRGIKRVSINNGIAIIEENGKDPLICSPDNLSRLWRQWSRQGRYMVQKWIDITSPDGRPHDIRVVVHKNGSGEWQLGGLGIRKGAKGKITSNVQSGGKVLPFIEHLTARFGEAEAVAMAERCERLAKTVAEHMEAVRQRRLIELGLDLGIDAASRLWLIEVNIKPGRMTIRRLYGREQADQVIRSHVAYARHLLSSRPI